MIVALWLVAVLHAGPLPPLPARGTLAPSECIESIPVRAGLPIPQSLMGSDGLARCSAVAEPLSSYAHLLVLEEHARLVRRLYDIEVSQLAAERDQWKERAEAVTVPLTHRPWFVAVTATALVTGSLVAYSLSTEDRQ